MDQEILRTARAGCLQAIEALERESERGHQPEAYGARVADCEKALAELDRSIRALESAEDAPPRHAASTAKLRSRWSALVLELSRYPGFSYRAPADRARISELVWDVGIYLEELSERKPRAASRLAARKVA